MRGDLEAIEERMATLRVALRQAIRAGERPEARRLRGELRELDERWNALLGTAVDAAEDGAADADAGADASPAPAGHLPEATAARRPVMPRAARDGAIPVREQVHQALTLLGAPAAPKLISQVHEAFFAAAIVPTQLASLRRDEAKSFAAAPYARPYYICAALAFDRLVPARGLLAVSTWPVERRVVGPLGPRVDFLAHATTIAGQITRMRAAGHEPSGAALRLLRRFARNVPGAAGDTFGDPDPARVIDAARSESAVHAEADTAHRREAARRATAQLDDTRRLFGAGRLAVVRAQDAGG